MPTLESWTIVVTDANDLVREIHDRMPVILRREDYRDWLESGNQRLDGLLAMLRPSDPDDLTMHAVSRRVNSPQNDDRDLISPVASYGPPSRPSPDWN